MFKQKVTALIVASLIVCPSLAVDDLTFGTAPYHAWGAFCHTLDSATPPGGKPMSKRLLLCALATNPADPSVYHGMQFDKAYASSDNEITSNTYKKAYGYLQSKGNLPLSTMFTELAKNFVALEEPVIQQGEDIAALKKKVDELESNLARLAAQFSQGNAGMKGDSTLIDKRPPTRSGQKY